MQETQKSFSTKQNPLLTLKNRTQNPSKRKVIMSLKRKEQKMEADLQRYRRQVNKITKAIDGLKEISPDTGALLIFQSDHGTFDVFCTNELMTDVWKNGVNETFRETVQDYLNENRESLTYKGRWLDDPELEKINKESNAISALSSKRNNKKEKGDILKEELRVVDKEDSRKIGQTRTAVLKVTAKTPSVEKTIEKTSAIRREKAEYRRRLFQILEMMTVEEMQRYLESKNQQAAKKSADDLKVLSSAASALKKRKIVPKETPKKSRRPVERSPSSSSASDSFDDVVSTSDLESEYNSSSSNSYSSSSSDSV